MIFIVTAVIAGLITGVYLHHKAPGTDGKLNVKALRSGAYSVLVYLAFLGFIVTFGWLEQASIATLLIAIVASLFTGVVSFLQGREPELPKRKIRLM